MWRDLAFIALPSNPIMLIGDSRENTARYLRYPAQGQHQVRKRRYFPHKRQWGEFHLRLRAHSRRQVRSVLEGERYGLPSARCPTVGANIFLSH